MSVRDLTKIFPGRGGGHKAVDAVSFELEPGGALGIVGESGSGKTTIARMLIGLESATAGSMSVLGRDRSRPARGAAERRARARELQIVFQDPYTSLDPSQSARAAVDEVLRHHAAGAARAARADASTRSRSRSGPDPRSAPTKATGPTSGSDPAIDTRPDADSNTRPVTSPSTNADPRDARARQTRLEELLDQVGLTERQSHARPRDLSGGQRQRVAIARALAADPAVLILDEAVSALDVSIQAQILNLLVDIRARTGIAYILISHDLAVVRQLCDSALVLRSGRVIEQGSCADILDNPAEDYTRALRAAVPVPGWRPPQH
ncbi:ABC transporter ATP-binding protein [Actinospica durhamensis]|uniref:ABC transporter ATP-binding protein n=1 Tax=Actinospica durhamensis TaxID=1508375 RepID=A0A941EVG2_9ACTN|nr:ATP-binding cassette domain-containing protein [Actinospica durhamensis]MBR7839030.1 ABC transporter ATP-binding protein [Actinospica durhamensis]